ncbi:MAG: hypothetical protein JKY65_03905 [Planctomycetes bacterium]|nr:hypothetical protein [Planctomycetota bacterium]
MDRLLRELERKATAGDPVATEKLAFMRRRGVDLAQLVEVLKTDPSGVADAIVGSLDRSQVQRFLYHLQNRHRPPTSSFDPPWPIEQIRARPAMWIGDINERGLHSLIWEAVALSTSEVHEGRCTCTRVEICADGSALVADDGHAPLIEVAASTGRASVDLARVKSEGRSPMCGLGVVAALSARLEVECVQGGELIKARFARGEPVGLADPVGPSTGSARRIQIWPDPEVFHPGVDFDAARIAERLRVLAALMPKARFEFKTPASEKPQVFASPAGLLDLLPQDSALALALAHEAEGYYPACNGIVRLNLALTYRPSGPEQITSFCNDDETTEHGVHWAGFAAALTAALNAWSRLHLGAGHQTLTGERCRSGLSVAIAVWLPEPQYLGSTRGHLGNVELPEIVRELAEPGLRAWLEVDPVATSRLIRRLLG